MASLPMELLTRASVIMVWCWAMPSYLLHMSGSDRMGSKIIISQYESLTFESVQPVVSLFQLECVVRGAIGLNLAVLQA